MKHEAERIRQYFDRVEMSESFKQTLLELEAQPAASPARTPRRSFQTRPVFKLVLAGAMCLAVVVLGVNVFWRQPAGNVGTAGGNDPVAMDAPPPGAVGSAFQDGVDASAGLSGGPDRVTGSGPADTEPGSAVYAGTYFTENGRSFLTWDDPNTQTAVVLDVTDNLVDGVFDDVYTKSDPPVHVVFVLNEDQSYSLTVTPASLD